MTIKTFTNYEMGKNKEHTTKIGSSVAGKQQKCYKPQNEGELEAPEANEG